jgi:hypothetical protein
MSPSKLIVLLLACLPFGNAKAQKFLPHREIGFWAGGSHYMGDLNNEFIFIPIIRPAGGLIWQKNFSNRWSWRNTANFGQISGDDRHSNQPLYNNRNLHFKSIVAEVNSQAVFNFFPFEIGAPMEGWVFPFSPYMFWGLGAFYFNPKAQYQGVWYKLKDLDTEGQGTVVYMKRNYSRVQVNMPFGMGIKAGIGPRASLGFEWGFRKIWSDYIDDVSSTYPSFQVMKFERGEVAAALSDPSLDKPADNPEINAGRQRGNSKNRDWYSFFGVVYSIKIANPKAKCPTYRSGGGGFL